MEDKQRPARLPLTFNYLENRMPQNTKDSKGGKSHAKTDTSASGAKKTGADSKNPNSPTGPQNKGEKKTTP
jgi:hypothetical protein